MTQRPAGLPSPERWSNSSMTSSPVPVTRSRTSWSTSEVGRRGSGWSPTGTTRWTSTPYPSFPEVPRPCWTPSTPVRCPSCWRSVPGVERPLTSEKHFRRPGGRRARLTLADGSDLNGRIGATDHGVVDLVVRAGGTWTVRRIPLTDIREAVVQVEFSAPGAEELELAGGPPARPKRRPGRTSIWPRCTRSRSIVESRWTSCSRPSSPRC